MNITVIIPVKNGEKTLLKCLQSLKSQTGVTLQFIILDSGSIDESKNIALQFCNKIVDIDPLKFNHGATRNLGITYAIYDLVFFTVQDAYLGESDTLFKMSNHFNNQNVMGVVGHQAIPHDLNKNPYLWYNPVSAPETIFKYIENNSMLENIPLQEKRNLFAWDNVVAMYRMNALQLLPFETTQYAEDWIWCSNALKKQWTLVYDTSVIAFHYHHQTFRYSFQSHYIINKQLYVYLDLLPPKPTIFLPIARVVYFFAKHKEFTFFKKCFWIVNNTARISGSLFANLFTRMHVFIRGKKSAKIYFKIIPNTIPQGQQKK